MDKMFFKNNRNKFTKQMEKNSLAIFMAKQIETGNTSENFEQDKNFFYFTGLEIPNAILVIHKSGAGKAKNYLFLEKTVEELIVWTGEKTSKTEAKNKTGVEKAFYLDEFERKLNGFANFTNKVYIDYQTSSLSSVLTPSLQLVNNIKEHYPNFDIKSPIKLLENIRTIKEEPEIENIKKAIAITYEGIKNILNHARPEIMEYELEAHFRFESLMRGKKALGFEPIVAGGVNSTILHYSENNCKIKDNSLVLLDLGAQHNLYSADISRTFPINGKFSERQKSVYEEVLKVQKEIINFAKPGLTLKDLQTKTIELIKNSLYKLDLINDKDCDKAFKKYYMHSVSHHLGLDTHDLASKTRELEPGNVITVEPGIYIKDEKIGVRIEDDILITKDGATVLSSIIPKEAEEIENLMKN